MEPAEYSQLRGVKTQTHVTVLVGPTAGRGEKALTSAADTLSGTTLIKIEEPAQVAGALLLALRTGPAVLAIAGQAAFVSEVLGGLLALQDETIAIPPVLLLSPRKDAAAPLALNTAGPPMPILQTVSRLIKDGSIKNYQISIPLLQINVSSSVSRTGLIFGIGAYAEGLRENFQGMFDKASLMRLHMLPKSQKPSGDGSDKQNADLARLAPDTGGTLTTYLYGAVLSALPLPLLSSKRPTPDKPIIYLATERSRKARMAALRAFGGKMDKAQPYYGVHLARVAALTIRMPGPYSLDGVALDLPETFKLTPKPPLAFLELSDRQEPDKP